MTYQEAINSIYNTGRGKTRSAWKDKSLELDPRDRQIVVAFMNDDVKPVRICCALSFAPLSPADLAATDWE